MRGAGQNTAFADRRGAWDRFLPTAGVGQTAA